MSGPDDPRFFAREGYAVLCGGQQLRHHSGTPFASPEAAENWADHAHCCPGRHVVCRVDTLRELRR